MTRPRASDRVKIDGAELHSPSKIYLQLLLMCSHIQLVHYIFLILYQSVSYNQYNDIVINRTYVLKECIQ